MVQSQAMAKVCVFAFVILLGSTCAFRPQVLFASRPHARTTSTFSALAPRTVTDRQVLTSPRRLKTRCHVMASLPVDGDSLGLSHVTASAITAPVLLAFADQGQNLAGIFFQGSLPPYLAFLYFLGFEKNRTPPQMYGQISRNNLQYHSKS